MGRGGPGAARGDVSPPLARAHRLRAGDPFAVSGYSPGPPRTRAEEKGDWVREGQECRGASSPNTAQTPENSPVQQLSSARHPPHAAFKGPGGTRGASAARPSRTRRGGEMARGGGDTQGAPGSHGTALTDVTYNSTVALLFGWKRLKRAWTEGALAARGTSSPAGCGWCGPESARGGERSVYGTRVAGPPEAPSVEGGASRGAGGEGRRCGAGPCRGEAAGQRGGELRGAGGGAEPRAARFVGAPARR